jgi:hypothetical protein
MKIRKGDNNTQEAITVSVFTHIQKVKLKVNKQNQLSLRGKEGDAHNAQTEALKPIARAPAPTPPSHPKNRSLVNLSLFGALP